MRSRISSVLALSLTLALPPFPSTPAPACCPAPPPGREVVNADQTVLLIWDPKTKTEHFIRRASFKSDADDFGFVVPTPTQPALEESGNEAFPALLKITEPEVVRKPRPSQGTSCGCALLPQAAVKMNVGVEDVRTLEEKTVAGFHATVLEADSATALVDWLKDHGYSYTPQMKAWAEPYVRAGWKFTALKVAKSADEKDRKSVAASALRISFKTDRPLFPYREPDPSESAAALGMRQRLLRIYFIGESRYQGELTRESPWTGAAVWSNKLDSAAKQQLLADLKLGQASGPEEWWLTEFEDNWPYRAAPADLYFARSDDQTSFKRPPIVIYVDSRVPGDATAYALLAVVILPPLWRRLRRRGRRLS